LRQLAAYGLPTDPDKSTWQPEERIVQSVLLGDDRWVTMAAIMPPLSETAAPTASGGNGGGSDTATGLPTEVEQRITLFVQWWRRNFLQHVKPQHLPPGWSVTYPVIRGTLRNNPSVSEARVVQSAIAHFTGEGPPGDPSQR
jgi:hypothetical protein